jgi:hypothetical protein
LKAIIAFAWRTAERFDAFFYCPDLIRTYDNLKAARDKKEISLIKGGSLKLRPKLTFVEKNGLRESGLTYKYIEIGDVTQYGLITKYIENVFDELPSRGEYLIRKGDILLALNNRSRGTVVLVTEDFDKAVCTSGFLVIVPGDEENRYIT